MKKSSQTIGFGVPPPGRWLGAARPPTLSLAGQSRWTSWRHRVTPSCQADLGIRIACLHCLKGRALACCPATSGNCWSTCPPPPLLGLLPSLLCTPPPVLLTVTGGYVVPMEWGEASLPWLLERPLWLCNPQHHFGVPHLLTEVVGFPPCSTILRVDQN